MLLMLAALVAGCARGRAPAEEKGSSGLSDGSASDPWDCGEWPMRVSEFLRGDVGAIRRDGANLFISLDERTGRKDG